MSFVHYSKRAKQDLLDIWLWIARDNAGLADAVLDCIERRANKLSQHREIGAARPEIGEGARGLVVERWLVLYRLVDSGVQIVRIVDGTRDLGRLGWPE
ncbi:MAG: type II toxin-antitoxin system RelE/ParE family toxin [Bosea sp.]|uniref:type II toxin-antitoxin system RelE/ParE family toxin n=1 Tax=Bosea sp. (in: a-proteobacteria) TaxID=1871050 RepID=UPI00238C7FE8|nr:type II toxin-antitoxin system RelE/ParE family toxin [Bosea sp. (in: a-proteobacteria)]MCP4740442.1 type II toxin-antitoxin system RelE/ParE family toxin [Bosea sp. (in: a-proteobacteria)]